MKKEVLLYSSGIDSYIARKYLLEHNHDFDCLYFNYKGKYSKNEISKIMSLEIPVIFDNRLDLSDLEQPDAYIPNRNILLSTLALSLGYEKVWIGGSLSDRVGDNQKQVFDDLSKIMTDVNQGYHKIDSPFYNCYKVDMVKWFRYNFPTSSLDLVTDTFSCYNPNKESQKKRVWMENGGNYTWRTKECLNCKACFRKSAALYAIGWIIDFENLEIINKYEDQFRKSLVQDPRSINTLEYIKEWWRLQDAKKREEKSI